ncbi:predicted cobalamin binding protein [Chthonomonas calidirosea]|uniref:Predicted cobalamin binding protein n=2 Tax=Chthonomonas TaxID=1077265 RepID=S0EYF2_CHTCT|nr:metalloregulator ArsR/SmtB family transcription factor [Chthonomonas calidirosea]CCW36690.1 Predicted cobalamin binding protein [Chthonomonas calidirosea T49]CEK15477.1 predicted cobalamin binding protein [Chthonomonas calidirosea]CEK16579.1 predicted cobalamin binding protein [Chthonomonas calidirosea]
MRGERTPDALSRALAEPSRRAILESLQFGRRTVTELVRATGLKQPNVSNHLAKMRQQGLVRAERVGRFVYYSLAMPFADVLLRMHEIAASATSAPQSSTPNPSTEVSSVNPPSLEQVAAWRKTLLDALLQGEESTAVILVNSMLAQGVTMPFIYEEIFQFCLQQIGEMYQQGLTDEAHEHLASAIVERLMARIAQFYTPIALVGCRAVLGCVAGNWHQLGLRMIADSLHALGWETLFLGANVPTPSFVEIVRSAKPNLVVVSVAMQEQWDEAQRLLQHLNKLRQEHAFLIAVGGHYIDDHPELVPQGEGFLSAPTLSRFLEYIRARWPKGCYEETETSRNTDDG